MNNHALADAEACVWIVREILCVVIKGLKNVNVS